MSFAFKDRVYVNAKDTAKVYVDVGLYDYISQNERADEPAKYHTVVVISNDNPQKDRIIAEIGKLHQSHDESVGEKDTRLTYKPVSSRQAKLLLEGIDAAMHDKFHYTLTPDSPSLPGKGKH